MAKRLTATEKWDKAWFRKLKPSHKVFWEYLRDKCDFVGLWEIDFESASFHIGEEVSEEEIFKAFEGKIIKVDDKILILGFCHFQYGKVLSEKSTIHKKVKNTLLSLNLFDTLYNTLSTTLSNSVEEEVKVKEEREEEVKEESKIIFPFDSENFRTQWQLWKSYKHKQFGFKYKTTISEQGALKKLSELAQDEKTAIKIIHESISQGWKGFFNLKINGKSNSNSERYEVSENLKRRIAEKLQS